MIRKYKRIKKNRLIDREMCKIIGSLPTIEPEYECGSEQQTKMMYPELPEYPKDIQKEYLKEKEKWESILNSRMSSKNSTKK